MIIKVFLILFVVTGLIGGGLFLQRFGSENKSQNPIIQHQQNSPQEASPTGDLNKTILNELQFASKFTDLVNREAVGKETKITVEESNEEPKKILNVEIMGDSFISEDQLKTIGTEICQRMSLEDKSIYRLKVTSIKTISTSTSEKIERSGNCR